MPTAVETTSAAEIESPGSAPQPLGALLARLDRAVTDLATGVDEREALHVLRSGLSDICALTEEDTKIRRAVDRLVRAGDRLAEGMITADRPRRTTTAWSNAARLALTRLDNTLASAHPSRIAVSLGRGW